VGPVPGTLQAPHQKEERVRLANLKIVTLANEEIGYHAFEFPPERGDSFQMGSVYVYVHHRTFMPDGSMWVYVDIEP
jgi:hypothetical protein